MDQNVFFDGTILNPAWISSISEVSSSLWISESKSAAWWIHRKSNMGPINCHEVKIHTIIYNETSWNVRHYHTWFSPRFVENPDVSLFSYGFPMVLSPSRDISAWVCFDKRSKTPAAFSRTCCSMTWATNSHDCNADWKRGYNMIYILYSLS